MNKIDKARDLYLRGFNSEYIKRRTGIPMQSLLKQLLAKGERYDKSDIIRYQIEYISSKYTAEAVEDAYEKIIGSISDIERARKGRRIECLGCGFGDYPKVFRAILGDARYSTLKNKCWKKKQNETVKAKYGVDNVFRKETFSAVVSREKAAEGRRKRKATMLARYGVAEPNQNPEFKKRAIDNMHKTMKAKYGVEHAMQRPEMAVSASKARQRTMLERYGAANSVQVKEIREKIFSKRAANGTVNTSEPENALYAMLAEKFGEEHVRRNAIIDNRYPYHVDFYIDTVDLFIELNGDRTHNGRWFDPDSERDRQALAAYAENAARIEADTGKISRYRKYIRVWSITDVEKRSCAKKNNLHYLVFWDGSRKGGKPQLSDARAWFEDGCPMPEEWRKENTY